MVWKSRYSPALEIHDKYFEKILDLGFPELQLELTQAVYVAGWLAPTIPGFAEWRDKFGEFMDLKGKTLKALAKLNIPVHWNDSLNEDWRNFRVLLAAASERYL